MDARIRIPDADSHAGSEGVPPYETGKKFPATRKIKEAFSRIRGHKLRFLFGAFLLNTPGSSTGPNATIVEPMKPIAAEWMNESLMANEPSPWITQSAPRTQASRSHEDPEIIHALL